MEKIIVKKTPHLDTEFTDDEITKELLIKETEDHIGAINNAASFMSDFIKKTCEKHDNTKFKEFDMFFDDCLTVHNNPDIDFKSLKWHKLHCQSERHHLKYHVPDDVNLVDVLELIMDSVVSGLARRGEIKKEYFVLDPDLLQEAVWNTALLLRDNCSVEFEDE